MPSFTIRGINVDFPFEPYESQMRYMDKVIESLQNKCHALLESPTGTGKTLCLLCATLAWRKSMGSFSTQKERMKGENPWTGSDEQASQSGGRGDFPTIVYASRTHSQLQQVIKELKRSSYRPKMMVLGSREQLCVNEKVNSLRGKALTNACQHLCKKRVKFQCDHFNRIPDYLKHNPQIGDEPVDIEDLVNIGKGSGPCPYYLTREVHKDVDILFVPYNYLISNAYRKYLKVNWDNSVLIFDEAHNLESLCADSASFDLPSGLLAACISEAQECVELAAARRDSFNDLSANPENFAILKGLLLKLQELISNVPIRERVNGFTKPGPYIYEMLHGLNITHQTAPKVIGTVEDAVVLLEEEKQRTARTNAGSKLEIIADMLKLIFREEGSNHADVYRVHVQEIEQNSTDAIKGKVSRTLSWWCFNPGITMQNIAKKGVRSIILTSGTLSPLNEMAGELKLDFPVRLENPHVISPNQLWAGVLCCGPKGVDLNSSYRCRDIPGYKEDLGNAIVNFSQVVPDGLLIFFPSYHLMDSCISSWREWCSKNSTTIWERICKHKRPVIEPKDSSLFASAMQDFAEKLQDKSASGAVFFAVCRGKVSEGLDFADRAGRAVVITGIPYARVTDPRVKLKREYLDEQVQLHRTDGGSRRSTLLCGSAWYSQEAARAVNQAIGRVIRHRHDYGAIILCDSRFEQPFQQSQISLWIRPSVKCFSRHEEFISDLGQFFRTVKSSLPARLVMEQANNIVSTLVPVESTKEVPSSASGNINVNNVGNARIDLSRLEAFPPANQALSLQRDGKNIIIRGKELTILPRSVKIPRVVKRDVMQACSSRKAQLVELSDDETPVEMRCDGVGLESDNREKQNSETSCFNSMGLIKKRKVPISLEDASFRKSTENPSPTLLKAKENEARDNKEASASAFLSQAQGKLNAEEYKKFIGYMQGLKKKEMKLASVMPSIVQLFSGPERYHLLMGFKDFVPVKYRPDYDEQCLKRREEKGGKDKC